MSLVGKLAVAILAQVLPSPAAPAVGGGGGLRASRLFGSWPLAAIGVCRPLPAAIGPSWPKGPPLAPAAFGLRAAPRPCGALRCGALCSHTPGSRRIAAAAYLRLRAAIRLLPLPPAAILPSAVVLVGGALYFEYIAGGIFVVGWVPDCIPQELIYGILAQY